VPPPAASTLLLDEKVIRLSKALEAADLPHAFGGALALAYYGTPRGTHDIDVNFFVPAEQASGALALLEALGVDPADDTQRASIERDGQVRLHWQHTPLDLFFSYDALHDACMERRRRVAFGEDAEIFVLSAEDLLIFKCIFDRPKDWNDMAEMLYAMGDALDTRYATSWLERILAADDHRLLRYRQLLEAPA
jgi:hypothetical protein